MVMPTLPHNPKTCYKRHEYETLRNRILTRFHFHKAKLIVILLITSSKFIVTVLL